MPIDKEKELSGESSKPIIARTVKTIKLQNKDYAQVADRVAEFNRIHSNGSITTTYEFKDGWVIFKATISLDIKNENRIFTGTSLGKAGAQKAFEKLETIAVGRALAFAGFLSDGSIASSEEMQKYEEVQIEINEDEAIAKLTVTKTLEELQKVWVSLSQAERNNPIISKYKDQLKKQYENTPSRTKDTRVATTPQGEDNRDRVKESVGV